MTHDPISPDDWALVRRYLTGDTSPDESARAEAALARDPRLAALRGTLRTTTPSADLPLVDTVALKQRIDARRTDASRSDPSRTDPSRTDAPRESAPAPAFAMRARRSLRPPRATVRAAGFPVRRVMTGLAAVAAALLVAVAVVAVRHPAATPTTYASYVTRDAQIAHVTLDDGTRATLAPRTTLRVARQFSAHRDVILDGEAYFDVAHTAGAPFLVHTGAVTTHVLGTAFDVRRYPTDRDTRVVVVSGKVAVAGEQGVTLTRGGLGRITDSTATATTVGDVTSYTSWTTGALAFREVPAADVLETVGRWYGLQFRFADSTLARKRLVATFAHGETRADALELISTLLDATLTFAEVPNGATVVTVHRKEESRHVAPPTRGSLHDPLSSLSVEVGR